MLRRTSSTLAIVAMVVTAFGAPAPAAAQGDSTCITDPTHIECTQGPGGDPGPGGGTGVSGCFHLGVQVECEHPEYGTWLGNFSGRLLNGDQGSAAGCWHGRLPQGLSPGLIMGLEGQWRTLSCLGDRTTPPVTTFLGFIEEGAEQPPDPGEVALRAFAALTITQPPLRVAPPETGAGLIGLPVWLSVDNTFEGFGPQQNDACDRGLCVAIEATVTHVDWEMGDGTTVTCTREQLLGSVWTPDRSVFDPPCGHEYRQPSRDLPDGRYPITATAHWLTTWSVETDDRTGFFDSQQTAGTSIRINEMQVLITYH